MNTCCKCSTEEKEGYDITIGIERNGIPDKPTYDRYFVCTICAKFMLVPDLVKALDDKGFTIQRSVK